MPKHGGTLAALRGDQRGDSGFVQSLILVSILALGGVAAVRTLSQQIGASANCAGQRIISLGLGADGCSDGVPAEAEVAVSSPIRLAAAETALPASTAEPPEPVPTPSTPTPPPPNPATPPPPTPAPPGPTPTPPPLPGPTPALPPPDEPPPREVSSDPPPLDPQSRTPEDDLFRFFENVGDVLFAPLPDVVSEFEDAITESPHEVLPPAPPEPRPPPTILSDDEFEEAAQRAFGGQKGRLPLSRPRPSGVTDVEIDLISEDTLTQVKRVTSPRARFGQKNREQLELTLDAARLAGKNKIRYVVADETPPAFVDEIRRTFEELTRDMPPPRPELTIERLPATR